MSKHASDYLDDQSMAINLIIHLPLFQVRNRFGLYDEITEVSPGRKLRQCNWIRFLRYSLVYNEEVNLIGTKGPTGEPIFDLIKDVGPKTELVAFFVPERPEEAFLLPAIQYLRTTLFKRLIDNVLEESPLDLSTSLVMSKVFPASSPTHSLVEGKFDWMYGLVIFKIDQISPNPFLPKRSLIHNWPLFFRNPN